MSEVIQERYETSLREFLSVVFRRKWIVLAVFGASLGLVAAMDRLSPPEYESYSQLLISRGQPESAYTSRVRVLSWEEDLNSELETVKSAHILQLAQKLLDEQKARDSGGRPIRIDPARVSSTTPGKSSVIYVKVRDRDPDAAREIARAVTQAYTSFRLNVRTVPEIDAFFREEIEGVRAQLEEAEQRRAEFMNEESVSRLQEERYSLIQVREEAEKDLVRIRQNLAAERARSEVLHSQIEGAHEDPNQEIYAFSEPGVTDDQVILQVRRELVTRRSELYQARSQYQPSHPEVLRLTDQVEQLQQLLIQEADNYLRHVQARIDVLRAREESLLNTLAYCDGELSAFPSKEARLSAFDRVIDALRADHQSLVDRQIQARLERVGSHDWNVLVLQAASDAVRIQLNDAIRLAVIPAIGLIVALAMAFVIDGMDHSLKDATEVERHLGLPVLGSLGRMR